MKESKIAFQKQIEVIRNEVLTDLWEKKDLLPGCEEITSKKECYRKVLEMDGDPLHEAFFEAGFIRACDLILGSK